MITRTSLLSVAVMGLATASFAQNREAVTLRGQTKQGTRAVRESVAAMMARQAVTPMRTQIVKNDSDERYPDRSSLRQAPGAIDAASFPVRAGDLGVAQAAPVRPGGPNSVLDPAPLFSNANGFRGVIGSESPYQPPDTNGDVSPSTVFFHINGRIRTYGRDGSVGALNVDPNVFFNSVRPSGSNIFDPRVRYDRLIDRFILVAIDGGNNNRIYVAVSDSGTITANSTFSFFTFAQGVSGRPNVFADYPTLGIDRNALYIGTNDFTSSYQGSTAYVVRKSSILGSGPIVATGFANVNASGAGPGMVTPQGVDNDDPGATTGYFIGTSSRFLGELSLARVNDPAGTPTLTTQIGLSVLSTNSPSRVPQSGSTNGLDTVGDRLFLAKICYDQNANRRTLWTSHNINVNASGVASNSGARVGSRWYQIQGFEPGGTPSLVQAGTVYDPAATTPRGFFIPSVLQTLQGHALLGSSVSSATMFGSATASYRLATDPLGTMVQDLRAKNGTSAYGGNRWGDYSMATVDPQDGMSVWSFQQYTDAGNWAVWAQKTLAPAPTISAGPIVRRGQSGEFTIEGTGFFDPPASYPNHLAFSIVGNGITASAPTSVAPTQIRANFAVAANAPLGSRQLTVVNPDGQLAQNFFTVRPILLTGTVTFGDYPAATKPEVTIEFVNAAGTVVGLFVATPNADGTVALEPNAPAGTFTVRVRASHFLRRVVAGVDASGGTAAYSVALINGDANNDNSVTIADVNVVRAALGSSTGSATYNANADLNGDGSVTIADVNIVRGNLGRSGD